MQQPLASRMSIVFNAAVMAGVLLGSTPVHAVLQDNGFSSSEAHAYATDTTGIASGKQECLTLNHLM